MLYLSTTNPAEIELRAAIEGTAIQSPRDLEFEYTPPEDLLTEPEPSLTRVRPESYVVITPIDGLEQGEYDQYLSFITSLKRRLRDTDSIGVVYGLDTDPVPDSRRLTLQRADYVWRIEQLILSREIATRLLITKARRGRALSEPIPLMISDHVRIDTSRRIA